MKSPHVQRRRTARRPRVGADFTQTDTTLSAGAVRNAGGQAAKRRPLRGEVVAIGKRADKRRKRKKARAALRRAPYDGMRVGPLTIERYGRRLQASVDTNAPNFEHFRKAIEGAVAAAPAAYEERLARLQETLAEFDAFDVLAALWMVNAVANPETYKEWEHPGVIAIPEFAAALLLRRASRAGARAVAPVPGEAVVRVQDELHELIQLNAIMLMEDSAGGPEGLDAFGQMRAAGRTHRLAVRSPSYDWQESQTVRELFDDKQIRDDVLAACGFTVRTALAATNGVSEIALERLRERAEQARAFGNLLLTDLRAHREGKALKDPRSLGIVEQLAPLEHKDAERAIHTRLIAWSQYALGETMSFTAQDLADHTGSDRDEIAAYLALFSLRFGVERESERPEIEDVRHRPIVDDGCGHHLCVSVPSLHWALRPAIERALKERSEKSFMRYERHRAKVIERRAVAALKKALDPDWVHEGLYYDVEEDGIKKRVEVDGLLRTDSALFIVESKASSMRPSARRLAPASLRDWLKREVSNAARQARRARRALVDEPSRPPLRDQSGKVITVALDGVSHSFELIVVLEDLAAVAASTWLLADAGVLPNDPIPFLVTLHDLELICEIVERPCELIHYLQRRRRMDETRRAWAVDELDYFMHYLLFGLFWDDAKSTDGAPPEHLLSHTEQLDSWFFYQRGIRKTPAERPSANHHPDVAAMLDCLERSRAPGRLDAALAILDLDGKPRRKIASLLKNLKRRSALDGTYHDASLIGPIGITVMTCAPADAARLGDKLRHYCSLKKHQMKLQRWVGFAGWSGPPEPIQLAVVFDDPWQPDAALDQLVATLPSAGVTTGIFDASVHARRQRRRSRK